MEQTNIFKKIYTKDRLPNEGWYNTDKGIEYYSEKLCQWASSMYTSKPEWWLEEVELPSKQELEVIASQEFGFRDYDPDNGVFCEGANYILNKLK